MIPKMRVPRKTDEVKTSMTSMTDDETHILGCHEIFGNAAASSSVPITSEEVAWQTKAASDSLTKQLGKLCDLMKELWPNTLRLGEKTSGPIQRPLSPRGDRFDIFTTMMKSDQKHIIRMNVFGDTIRPATSLIIR